MLNIKTINESKLLKDIAINKNDEELLKNTNLGLSNKFKQQKDIIKKFIQNGAYDSRINNLKSELEKYKLNKTVNTVKDAIEIIYKENLFKGLELLENTNVMLGFPLDYKYIGFIANTEEEVIKNNDNIANNYNLDGAILERTENQVITCEVYIPILNYGRVEQNNKNKNYYLQLVDLMDNKTLRYSFVDVYCILFNLDNKQALTELFNILNIEVLEVQHIKTNGIYNLKILREELPKYFYLNKYIKKNIDILNALINITIDERFFVQKSENKNYSYSSFSHLAKSSRTNKATVSTYILGLGVLGLVNKAQGETIKACRNGTSLFDIPKFTDEVLSNANNIAKGLIDRGVTISKLNAKVLIEIYGISIMAKLINDKVTIGRLEKNDKICG